MAEQDGKLMEQEFVRGDSDDEQFIDQLTAEATEYIHETAADEMVDILRNTGNSTNTIGAATYKIVSGLMNKHRKAGLALDVDMNHAMALGTEVVDMLLEVSQAVNPEAVGNTQKTREDSLLKAMVMHGEQLEKKGDPDAKEEAKIMLAGMMQDGTADEAFAYVNQRASEEGLSTADMQRSGNQLTKGSMKQNAVSEAVGEGLMSGGKPLPEMNSSTRWEPRSDTMPDLNISGPLVDLYQRAYHGVQMLRGEEIPEDSPYYRAQYGDPRDGGSRRQPLGGATPPTQALTGALTGSQSFPRAATPPTQMLRGPRDTPQPPVDMYWVPLGEDE